MHLVVVVVDCVELCSPLLEAWEKAGAVGITILESMGVRRLQTIMRDDLPLMPSLRDLVANEELYHRTLFTVVPDEATVDRIVVATEAVLGDLLLPNSGFLFVVPVSRALGLRKQERS
jgi:nitrogen regulatory protein PII